MWVTSGRARRAELGNGSTETSRPDRPPSRAFIFDASAMSAVVTPPPISMMVRGPAERMKQCSTWDSIGP